MPQGQIELSCLGVWGDAKWLSAHCCSVSVFQSRFEKKIRNQRSTLYLLLRFIKLEIQADPLQLQTVPLLKTSQNSSTSPCNPALKEYHLSALNSLTLDKIKTLFTNSRYCQEYLYGSILSKLVHEEVGTGVSTDPEQQTSSVVEVLCIDAIFAIWTYDRTSLRTIAENLNHYHPTINYTAS